VSVRAILSEEERSRIEARIGRRFLDHALLEQALTHASYANEIAAVRRARGAATEPGVDSGAGLREQTPPDYDRLEFLGDAILGMLLAEHAFERTRSAPSGRLTLVRARLAKRNSLAAATELLGLGPHVRLSEGELRQGGSHRRKLLADVFEAVLGAVYLDGGLDAAREFVRSALIVPLGGDEKALLGTPDPKTALQELLQGMGRPAPAYRLLEKSGPPHDPTFLVQVEIDGTAAGEGLGCSRREAERAAARRALDSCKRV
jgi:ribonuclease-3